MSTVRYYLQSCVLPVLAGVFSAAALQSATRAGYLGTLQIRPLIVFSTALLLGAMIAGRFAPLRARRVAIAVLLSGAAVVVAAAVLKSDKLVEGGAAALMCSGAIGLGAFLLQFFDREKSISALERLAIAGALGFGAISHAALLAGIFHLFYQWMALALVVAGVILGAVAPWRARALSERARHFFLDEAPQNLFFFATVLLFVVFVLLQCFAPAIQFDDLNYHLRVPYRQAEAHTLVEMPDVIQTYFYQGVETLHTVAFLLGGESTAILLNAIFGLLAMAALGGFAGRTISSRAGWLAASFWITTPLVAWLMTNGYVDMGTALFSLLSAVALFGFLERGGGEQALLAGLFAGFALSCKLNALVFVTASLAVCGAALLARRRYSSALAFAPRYAIGILVAGCPWPLVRYFQTGNPAFPFLNHIFKAPGHPPVNESFNFSMFGMGTNLASLLRVPWNATVHGERFIEALHPYALGPCLLLAIAVYALAEKRTATIRCACATAFLFLLVWFRLAQYNRYLMPIIPLLALLGAYGVSGMGISNRRGAASAITICACWLLFSSSFVIWLASYYNIPERVPFGVIFGREARTDYLRRCVPSYAGFETAQVACRSRSEAVLGMGSVYGYFCPSLIPWYAPRAAFVWQQYSDEGYLAALQRLSISYILVDNTANLASVPLLRSGFLNRGAELLYRQGAIRLYKLAASGQVPSGDVVAFADLQSAAPRNRLSILRDHDPGFERADLPGSLWIPDNLTTPQLMVGYDPAGYLPAKEGQRVLRVALPGPSDAGSGRAAAASFQKARVGVVAGQSYMFSCDLVCSGLIEEPLLRLHVTGANGSQIQTVSIAAPVGCDNTWRRVSADFRVAPGGAFVYPEFGFTFHGRFDYHRYVQVDELSLEPAR